jgi:predicted MPP superfamily phosphohydrolase
MPDWITARIIYFNITLTCVNAGMLWFFSRRPSLMNMILAVFSLGAASSVAASQFSTGYFSNLWLLSIAIFVFFPMLLLGMSIILRRKARKTAVAVFCLALLIVGIGVDAFFIEPYWLDVSHVTISSPKIERPLRIVFIADFQTDNISDYEEECLRRALAEKPDIILFGGDYLQVPRDRSLILTQETNRLFKALDFQAPEGVYAVKGNIDYFYPWTLIFTGLPVTTVNYTSTFDVAGIRLTCLSIYDSSNPRFQLREADGREHEADDEASDPFHIVLGHRPDYALGEVSADLLLAGHTHGGQVQLPFLGPIITMSRVPRDWASGITELPQGGRLLVSRGLGMERHGSPRLRFLCRPELVVIDLEPEKQAEPTVAGE